MLKYNVGIKLGDLMIYLYYSDTLIQIDKYIMQ